MNSAGLCLSFEASEQSEQSIAPCLCPRLLADTMADNFECQLEIGVPFYPFEWLCSKAPPICVGPYSSWDSSEHLPDLKHRICALDISGQLLPLFETWFCCFFLFFQNMKDLSINPPRSTCRPPLRLSNVTLAEALPWKMCWVNHRHMVAVQDHHGPPIHESFRHLVSFDDLCIILYLYIALLRTALCFCQVLIPYPTMFSHLN